MLLRILFVLGAIGVLQRSWGNLQIGPCVIAPFKCPHDNITFWLYNRANENNPYQIFNEEQSIKQAPFITPAPTIVLIHGYSGSRDFDPNPQIRPAYLRRGEYNVISVDYGPLVPEPCYPTAVKNVPLVGECTARLLESIILQKKIPMNSIHIIGFSLGAQVAGEIGKRVQLGKFERITGLDPAMPLFVTWDNDKKLDRTDAKFVDIVHTDALDRGKLEAVGHADFYINRGMRQPGCENVDKSAEGSCSHARAPIYYGESINSQTGFYGKRCDSWFLYMIDGCNIDNNTEEVIMGMQTPTTAQGLYFVHTNAREPYARGTWEEQQIRAKGLNETSESQAMSDLEHQRDGTQ